MDKTQENDASKTRMGVFKNRGKDQEVRNWLYFVLK